MWEVSRRQAGFGNGAVYEHARLSNAYRPALHSLPRAVQYSAASGMGEGLPYLGQDKNPGL